MCWAPTGGKCQRPSEMLVLDLREDRYSVQPVHSPIVSLSLLFPRKITTAASFSWRWGGQSGPSLVQRPLQVSPTERVQDPEGNCYGAAKGGSGSLSAWLEFGDLTLPHGSGLGHGDGKW